MVHGTGVPDTTSMAAIAPPLLPDRRRETVRVLLLVQASIFAMSAVEGAVAALAFANPVGVVGSTLASAATLTFAWAVGGGKPWTVLIWVERSLIAWFAVDLLLSLGVAHRPLELVPTLTRLVLPLAILRLVKALR